MNLNLKTLTTKLFTHPFHSFHSFHPFSKPEWHGARRLAIIYWGIRIQENRSNIKQEHDRAERFKVLAAGVKSVLVEEIGKEATEKVLSRYRIG
jgi:hypothetical protein